MDDWNNQVRPRTRSNDNINDSNNDNGNDTCGNKNTDTSIDNAEWLDGSNVAPNMPGGWQSPVARTTWSGGGGGGMDLANSTGGRYDAPPAGKDADASIW